jgi:hypothetical protein
MMSLRTGTIVLTSASYSVCGIETRSATPQALDSASYENHAMQAGL